MSKKRSEVAFKKKPKRGQCRAMRCKETYGLTEVDVYGDLPAMLLCARHLEQVGEDRGSPVVPVTFVETVRTATDGATGNPIYSLDGGATWAFGEPPEDDLDLDPTAAADAHRRSEVEAAASTPETPPVEVTGATSVTVEHAPALALIDPLRNEYADMGAQLVDFVVDSPETFTLVGELLVGVQTKMAKLEKARKSIVRPLLDAKSAVDDLFRPATEAADTVKAMLKGALSKYETQQREAQVAQLAAGNHTEALAVEQPVLPKGVSSVTVWKWKVTDPALIPRNYLVIDSAAVQEHINTYKGQSNIPGVEAFMETDVRARAQK